jgi:hypothetical protein
VPELADGGLILIINEIDSPLTRSPDVQEDRIGNNYRLLCKSCRLCLKEIDQVASILSGDPIFEAYC